MSPSPSKGIGNSECTITNGPKVMDETRLLAGNASENVTDEEKDTFRKKMLAFFSKAEESGQMQVGFLEERI